MFNSVYVTHWAWWDLNLDLIFETLRFNHSTTQKHDQTAKEYNLLVTLSIFSKHLIFFYSVVILSNGRSHSFRTGYTFLAFSSTFVRKNISSAHSPGGIIWDEVSLLYIDSLELVFSSLLSFLQWFSQYTRGSFLCLIICDERVCFLFFFSLRFMKDGGSQGHLGVTSRNLRTTPINDSKKKKINMQITQTKA